MVKTARARSAIVAMLFVNVVISYMDRANLSIAGPALSRELKLTPTQMGWAFSAFGWAYAFLQIPGGWLVDGVRPRLLYACSLVSWSVATVLQALAGGFATIFGLRLAIGAFQAPAYPINNRVITAYVPEQERAAAIAFYTSGQYIGLAFLYPVMALVQQYRGWQGLFVFTGAIGIAWGLAWYRLYRDPEAPVASGVSRTEGTGLPEGGHHPAPKRRLKEVFNHRKLWGIYLGQFCVTSALWFFLTWFPTYLEQYRGFSVASSGWLRSVPFLAACAGIITSGLLSDFLARRGLSAGVARKTPVIIGLMLTTAIVGANYVSDQSHVIFFLSVAFFGNGMAAIGWVFVSILAPRHLIGLIGGTFNFFGNLPSIVVPIIIGHLVSGGDFAPALVFIAALAVAGIGSYVFLVGAVEPIAAAELH